MSTQSVNRRCSFCRMVGHTVVQCNDVTLYEFRKICVGNRIILEIEDDSVNQFKLWLYESSLQHASLIATFARRFCKVPIIENSILRLQKITHYIYHMSPDEMIEITNARNDYIVNLALFNSVEVLQGLLFTERVEYLTRVIEYLTSHASQPSESIPPLKLTLSLEAKTEPDNVLQCSICYEDKKKTEFANLSCHHCFCGDCMISMMRTRIHAELHCPLCRKPIEHIQLQNQELQVEMYKHFQ